MSSDLRVNSPLDSAEQSTEIGDITGLVIGEDDYPIQTKEAEEWYGYQDDYCPVPYPKCNQKCVRKGNICISDYSIDDGADESFVPPSAVSSAEDELATYKMLFDGIIDDPNMGQCINFWKRVLENNLEPLKCTVHRKSRTKIKKPERSESQTEPEPEKLNDETVKEAKPCDAGWCFEVWDEIKRLKLDQVKLVRHKCHVCDLPPDFEGSEETSSSGTKQKSKRAADENRATEMKHGRKARIHIKQKKEDVDAKRKDAANKRKEEQQKAKRAQEAAKKRLKAIEQAKTKAKSKQMHAKIEAIFTRPKKPAKKPSEIQVIYNKASDPKNNSAASSGLLQSEEAEQVAVCCGCGVEDCVCQQVTDPEDWESCKDCVCGEECVCDVVLPTCLCGCQIGECTCEQLVNMVLPACRCGCHIDECFCEQLDDVEPKKEHVQEQPVPSYEEQAKPVYNSYCVICGLFHCFEEQSHSETFPPGMRLGIDCE